MYFISHDSIINTGGDSKLVKNGKIDFGDIKAVSDLIEIFCKSNANADVENALVISPTGNFYNIAGGKFSVETSVIGKNNLRGSICVHNHPVPKGEIMGDSFSRYDLGFAAEYKTGKQYLVSGKRRDSFIYTGNISREEIENKYNEAYSKLLELALYGYIEIEFEMQQTLEILNNILEGFTFYGNLRK